MPPLESQLLDSIERRLKALAREDPRLVWRKRHGSAFSTSGDPDLYGLWRGHHWEMELKRPGAEPTFLQCYRLTAWNRAGALTFVVHSLGEFDAAIAALRAAFPQ
jgi:hypothetical protein